MKKKRKKTHNDSDKAFLNTLTMETGFPRVPLEMTSRKKVINDVTRCQILRLKCTDSILARVLSQNPMGELTVLRRSSIAGFKGTERKEMHF